MSFTLISKYRTQLMGIAVLWIAILHASMWFPIEIINWIKLTGQGGVDIFLFLSSFGLYYAYQKESKPGKFFIKRLVRILPFYIPIALYKCIYLDYTMQETVMMLTTMSFWFTWDRSYWYVSAIIVLYIFTPFYLKLIKKNETKLILLSVAIAIVLSLFSLSDRWALFVVRIPVFLLGFLFGKWSYENKVLDKKTKWIILIAFIVGVIVFRLAFIFLSDEMLWKTGLHWYPMILITPGLCLYLSKFLNFLENHNFKFLSNELYKVGLVSFEFYLLHEVLLTAFTVIITINPMYNSYGYMLNIIILLITYAVSYYYQAGIKFGLNILSNIFKYFKAKKA